MDWNYCADGFEIEGGTFPNGAHVVIKFKDHQGRPQEVTITNWSDRNSSVAAEYMERGPGWGACEMDVWHAGNQIHESGE